MLLPPHAFLFLSLATAFFLQISLVVSCETWVELIIKIGCFREVPAIVAELKGLLQLLAKFLCSNRRLFVIKWSETGV